MSHGAGARQPPTRAENIWSTATITYTEDRARFAYSHMTARALIVDDEADIRALLEITLSRMGLETQAAASLDEARHALASNSYALCLTDMRLPDGLGQFV